MKCGNKLPIGNNHLILHFFQLLLPSLWALEVEQGQEDQQSSKAFSQMLRVKENVEQTGSIEPQNGSSGSMREESTAFPHFPPVDRGIPGSEPEV